jgi:hypothetical protein
VASWLQKQRADIRKMAQIAPNRIWAWRFSVVRDQKIGGRILGFSNLGNKILFAGGGRRESGRQ